VELAVRRATSAQGPARLGAVAVTALALALSGCMGGGSATLSATASFSDAEQLVPGAQVQMAGVPVGSVSAIALAGTRAKVTMSIQRSAHVPADLTAALDQTTVLGENFVELIPRRGSSTRAAPLADGATIAHTKVVPEAEQLVGAGAQVFGSISDSQLAAIIDAGGQGFGGQAANLRQLLNDFATVAAGYAHQTGQISSLITNLDTLGSGLAPSAEQDAQALSNLAQTVTVLSQQSGRFTTLLQALDNVAGQGRGILEADFPQIADQLTALYSTAHELAQHQQDLAGFLAQLPVHNTTTNDITVNDYVQVLENLIVCGIPDGGGNDASPAATCHGGSSGSGS
jgi:phospholipid/cholesterol/gamma-HCH transport system substrate-binding protein